MKISRTLAAAALSGALVLGGTTAAFAENEGVSLSDTLVYNGVTYYKTSEGNYVPAAGSGLKDEAGNPVGTISKADMEKYVESGEAKAPESAEEESESEETSEETTESKETTSEKTTEAKASESASATKSSAASSSASTTKSSDASSSASTTKSSDSSTTASATTTPSQSQSAEPTPTNEPGDKKSSARDALSSKDGKPTPLAIFGIVAGVLAAVAAAFPVIAKTLNLNIKLPF